MLAKSEAIQQSVNAMSIDADLVLWDELRKGNRICFEEIYRKHIDNLFNYGMLLFKEKAIVEDAVQDLFVDLWRRHQFVGETKSVKYYLRKALKRNIVRKLETKERLSSRFGLPIHYSKETTFSVEEELITNQISTETADTLMRAIKSLPEKQREIITYKFYDNLTSQEISSTMAISIDSVYTQISRAVKELRKRVKLVQWS